ncbi:LysE family translocator [Pseudomonas sp. dw_358]|uniref:LysE family translocator n=1 Tax=Pseudomonas sp. dw_358 TaxID=2720083 RepID=UPI001BD1CB91|nr:LysE family translocator [Pseudomonas sp. dw_358]
MGIDSFWPLAIFSMSATFSPGGATTLATASGAQFGFRHSIPFILGIATGLASMAAAAAFGLANVLLLNSSLAAGLKTVGTLYLLWLAWKVARAPAPGAANAATRPVGYFAAIALLWHNPKGWAMTSGAAAAYTHLASGPAPLAGLMGASFGLCAAISLSIWCVAGRELGRRVRHARHWRLINAVLGGLIVASIVPMWL